MAFMAGGAAIGSAIAPGPGTVIGAGIGYLGGRFLGNLGGDAMFGSGTATQAPKVASTPSTTSKQNEALMLKSLVDAGITDPQTQALIMGQLSHESGGFKSMNEIGGGVQYEGNRRLGNTQPGDGDRFRGRGFVQLTGRYNYTSAARDLGLDLVNNPDLAADPQNAAKIAIWYLQKKRGNGKSPLDYAQAGNFDGLTQSIQGSLDPDGRNSRWTRTSGYLQSIRSMQLQTPQAPSPAASTAAVSAAATKQDDPNTTFLQQISAATTAMAAAVSRANSNQSVYSMNQQQAFMTD
jgi:predicted chitinase